jgi:hypothetical protein
MTLPFLVAQSGGLTAPVPIFSGVIHIQPAAAGCEFRRDYSHLSPSDLFTLYTEMINSMHIKE